MNNIKKFFVITSVFAGFFFIPFNSMRISNAVMEALFMTQEYARDHILLCLLPAFFIAGAIGNFISQGAVIKFLGAKANKFVSYGVASVSGSILAVCSCTVLPLFGGIYKRGAGLGPAISFLYSGPAINVLAIIMTARILGLELGIARAISAVIFSIVIGIMMHFIFIKEENARNKELEMMIPEDENSSGRKLWQTALNIAAMIGILVFVNWGKDESMRFWNVIYNFKYHITAVFAVLLAVSFILWFRKDEMKSWVKTSFEFSLQIMPLLFAGVLIAGFLLGRPGHEGIIPSQWISSLVGGNSLFSNLFASIAGAFMYFATLTEVPILQGLIGSGMGKGPALALLLAGPALSLPSMLAIRSMIGNKKTFVYVSLVIVMSTITGMTYGALFGA